MGENNLMSEGLRRPFTGFSEREGFAVLCPFWDDLQPTSQGGVFYQVIILHCKLILIKFY